MVCFLGEVSFIVGNCVGDIVIIDIGNVLVIKIDYDVVKVDVLLCFDDVYLINNVNINNGEVIWVCYEGGSWLCVVKFVCDIVVISCVSYEVIVCLGDVVYVLINIIYLFVVYVV